MKTTDALRSASDILAAGREIQRGRLRVIAENMANADSISSSSTGDPYSRKIAVFSPIVPDSESDPVGAVMRDTTPFPLKYDPTNSFANIDGYMKLSNVEKNKEYVSFQAAIDSYNLSLNASSMIDKVTQATIDLLG